MFKALSSGVLPRIICCLLFLYSQEASAIKLKDNDEFYLKHLKESSYLLDTSAAAIVLYEKSLVQVTFQEHRGLVITQDVHRIIKVLKKAGSPAGDVAVTVLHNNDYLSDIKKVHGTTYNLINGSLNKQELDGKNVEEKASDNLLTAKFSLPSVREGSVIDYSYTIEKDFSLIFCFWEFQTGLPKLFSEAEVQVPGICNIVSVSQNLEPFIEFDDKQYDPYNNKLPFSYIDASYTNGQEYLIKRWVRRNVPAAFDEPFTNNYKNYTESLLLQLTGFQERAFKWKTIDSWKTLNKSLYESQNYYHRLESLNGNAKEKVKALASGEADTLQKAKNIFKYVRNNIRSENTSGFLVVKSLNEVFSDRLGTPSEINFLLIAMLRQAGLEAYPVIIGSRDVLKPLEALPVMERMDRTICMVQKGSERYYLDASDACNPFGIIPEDCRNGYAWVVSKNGESVRLEPEDAKEKELVTVTGTLSGNNKMELEIRHYLGNISGIKYRSQYSRDSAEILKELVSETKRIDPSAKISKLEIFNFSNPDTGLIFHYFVKFDLPAGSKEIFFAPQFIRYFPENPFKSSLRNYPVEMPSAMDLSYALQLQLPEGWEVSDHPESQTVQLDDQDQFKYLTEYDKAANMLRVNSRMQMRRASFQKDEYDLLKVFFDKMTELQQTNCVLKKTS